MVTGTPVTTTFGYTGDKLTSFGGTTIAYNAMGCPVSYNGKNYVWANGKLSRVYCGNSTQTGTLYEDSSYTYNGFGQRVRKYYAYDPNPGSTSDYSYTYDTAYQYDHFGRLIREYCTERHIGGNVTTREFVFLYDESGMIGVAYSLNGATAQSYFFRRNLLGDVIGIYDTSGNQVAGYAYDAWGNCTVIYGAGTDLAKSNPIRYRGYYYDRDTGLYYCNARYYSPKWRRFISPDDTSYLDPESVNGLNLYCYCNNDPVNYADPSGHEAKWWQWLLGGIGVALVAVAAGLAIWGTGGVAAFGIGALIGSVALGTTGAAIGGAVGYATGGTEGILGGALTGFGIGAIVGFVVGGVAYSYSGVTVDIRKFTEYALDPLKSKGKHNVFNDLGYYKENAHKLVKLYMRQGYKNWMKGAYELHQLDQHGQRITICIKVGDQVLKTGWMLVKHGIRLITPFSGFG